MYRSPYGASGIPIDSLFRDIYRLLEELQGANNLVDNVATCILHCSRELRQLEKVHGFGWRFYGANCSEDPFELQEILNKFMITCNALSYINSSHTISDEDLGDGCLFPAKKGWRKKQLKGLEIDFWEHRRTLGMALSHAV